MTYSFNLIDEPWIPCFRYDGTPVSCGIVDTLLEAHLLSGLRGDTPLETAAVHRLLLAVLHRIFGPKNRNEWKKLWYEGHFDEDRLKAYLHSQSVVQAFDLFDSERPFFQPRMASNESVPVIQQEKRKGKQPLESLIDRAQTGDIPYADMTPITSLVMHAASGNNSTLFNHTTEAVGLDLTPAQAARSLVTSQLFGVSGTSGVSTNFVDAPGPAKGSCFLQKETIYLKRCCLICFATTKIHHYLHPMETTFPLGRWKTRSYLAGRNPKAIWSI